MTARLSQKSDLRDYVKAYPGALAPAACESIIERFDAAGAYDERRNPLYSFDQINCNETPGFGDIALLVAQTASVHARRYFGSLGLSIQPQITGFEHVRLKRYLPGRDQFREHVDVADHASARRFLVCMIYLRDNRGGQTTFDGLGLSIACKQGRMAVFPPTWMFPHAGRAPLDVPKYTACTLLHYGS